MSIRWGKVILKGIFFKRGRKIRQRLPWGRSTAPSSMMTNFITEICRRTAIYFWNFYEHLDFSGRPCYNMENSFVIKGNGYRYVKILHSPEACLLFGQHIHVHCGQSVRRAVSHLPYPVRYLLFPSGSFGAHQFLHPAWRRPLILLLFT